MFYIPYRWPVVTWPDSTGEKCRVQWRRTAGRSAGNACVWIHCIDYFVLQLHVSVFVWERLYLHIHAFVCLCTSKKLATGDIKELSQNMRFSWLRKNREWCWKWRRRWMGREETKRAWRKDGGCWTDCKANAGKNAIWRRQYSRILKGSFIIFMLCFCFPLYAKISHGPESRLCQEGFGSNISVDCEALKKPNTDRNKISAQETCKFLESLSRLLCSHKWDFSHLSELL